MEQFNGAVWIWRKGKVGDDEYADFTDTFRVDGIENIRLRISCDSNYAVYINGELAAFGQNADYPEYKIYDDVDIGKYCREGENRLAVTVWYYGKDTQTYIRGKAALIYRISENDITVARSSEKTLSRLSGDYVSYEQRQISGQLGFTYHYNANGYDGFREKPVPGFEESVTVDGSKKLLPRPNEKLVLEERLPAHICMQGCFEYGKNIKENYHPAVEMQYAALSFRSFCKIATGGEPRLSTPVIFKNDEGDGIWFIVDLGTETSGFLSFDITVPQSCRIDVGYGEHLCDGRCRTEVRNFSCAYDAAPGRNVYLNPFRRFGCRYVQFFIHSHEAEIAYAGIRPTLYPLTAKKFKCGNLLRETIYDVCVNTLKQCLHEHYEDCPWREQALYAMDSRNQMLCGYYAFGEFRAARASLRLMAEGLRPDGLLTLCYPAGLDFPIPSFSTMYFVQMNEYIKYSGDKTLAYECFGVLEKLMNTFIVKIGEDGLIGNFYGKGGYWNFYEWSPTMAGKFNEDEYHVEAPINAFLSLALVNMSGICCELGKTEDAEKYLRLSEKINRAIADNFYNKETGLFESFTDREKGHYSVLTNSLCLLCGAASGVDKTNIFRILETNGRDNIGLTVFPNTLSMNCFRFDALLAADREKYATVILDEIDRDYLYMLRNGATSFWETIYGEADFGGAGSLCHGWSALPVYYYEILCTNHVDEIYK